jgi:ParB family transcriptional regulator, chromosome partitioning protein
VAKERRLGRGLEALLGMSGEPIAGTVGPTIRTSDAGHAGTHRPAGDGLLQLAVGEIEANPFQPRRDFDDAEIEALAASIKSHGLIQPIAVREVAGRYQLIAGERRLRAAIEAGWTTVPARLIEADDRLATELAIVENLQRKDLNAVEKAISFRQYIERYGCTQDELAGRLQINRSTVANFIRLLELPGEVQQAVREEKITYGHARALLPLGEEREQLDFCRRIQTEGLSVRAVEDLVQDVVHASDAEPLGPIGPAEAAPPRGSKAKPSKSKTTASLEQSLKLALGTRVDVRTGGKGRGKIIVHFTNSDEFERLFQFMTGPQFKTEAS